MADELVLLDLVGEVADVAAGAGDVPAGADDLGQVVALVDPARVAGLARVADEQRAAVAVGERLLLGLVARRTAPWASEPDVAVRVDEAREHPAARASARRSPSAGGVKDTPPTDDPQLVDDVVGTDEHLDRGRGAPVHSWHRP